MRLPQNGTPVRLVFRDPLRLKGRVLREKGGPVSEFSLDKEQVRTPDGRFSLPLTRLQGPPGVPRGPGIPLDDAEGGRPAGRDVDVGDVVLRESQRVSGQVVDSRTSEPVAGALVHAANGSYPASETYTGREGGFSLEDLNPDGVQLSVSHALYPRQKQVDWKPGQGEVKIRLEAGATLEGRVESDGAPVARGTVQLTANGELIATTDVRWGHYQFDLIPAGRYVVRVLGPRNEGPAVLFPLRPVELAPGARETLDLSERPSGASVQVLVPERNIEVHLIPGDFPLLGPKQGLYNRLSGGVMGKRVQDGVRHFSQLPAGAYTLVAVRPSEEGTEVHREEVEVPTEGALSLTLLPQWTHFDD